MSNDIQKAASNGRGETPRRNGLGARGLLIIRRPRVLLAALLLIAIAFLAGCSSKQNNTVTTNPAVTFTSVPVAGADNPEKLNAIKGRVIGAKPGQHIVLYAKGQTAWWVQPYANQPFTNIQANSKWSNSTHPGNEYAALLVEPGFNPPLTAEVLPTQGVVAFAITKGDVAVWQKWWFPFPCVLAAALAIFGVHRLRIHQMSQELNLRFEERLAERMRVAQELHDTLLQGVLSASMQLHVAVDQLPDNSPMRPSLVKILGLMGQVIEEGRNTLRGLRSSIDSAHDLRSSFLRVPQELGDQQEVDFRVVVEGSSVPLRAAVRDDVYSIGREALVNAFRHSNASNIEVELDYGNHYLRVLVRDDGCGIDAHVLESGRDGHWGLSGMRERAERIGAKLKVFSRTGAGTEVELRVPSKIAFDSRTTESRFKWFRGVQRRRAEAEEIGSRNGPAK